MLMFARMKPLLVVDDLHLKGRVLGVSLSLLRGETVALLGMNGAGKSSLLQMIAGALAPDSGQVRIDGAPLYRRAPAARHGIGLLTQPAPLYPDLNVREHLCLAARLQGLSRVAGDLACAKLMQALELDGIAQRLGRRLSTGMAQRVGLAMALVHNPILLVLDEPTAGLDPIQAERLRALIRHHAGTRGVILSTHLLEDVSTLCNRVLLLHEGRLIDTQTVDADLPHSALLARFRALAEVPA